MTEEIRPIDLVRDALNPDDELHAVIPTERQGDEIYCLTVRVQPSTSEEWTDEVVHVRTILVDVDAGSATWQGNGMIVPITTNSPLALGRALVGTHNRVQGDADRDVEATITNGMNGGDDELAAIILGAEEAEAEATDLEDEDDADRTATCDDCGAERPMAELVSIDLGGVSYVSCRGPCLEADDEEADDAE